MDTTRKRTLIVALGALPLLLALSYPWRDATEGVGMIVSSIGWFGFLLDLLFVLVLAVVMATSSVREGRRPSRS